MRGILRGTRRRPRWLAAAGCLAAAVVATILLAAPTATATPAWTSQPVGTKATAPENINPGKHPVTDPARITVEPPVPVPADQAVRAALAWEAQDPNSRVVCFAEAGTVAGEAELDRRDPSQPLTAAQRAELCAQMAHPPAFSERHG